MTTSHHAVQPPSTQRVWQLTIAASLLARKLLRDEETTFHIRIKVIIPLRFVDGEAAGGSVDSCVVDENVNSSEFGLQWPVPVFRETAARR
jgi:hypothetical protein